VLTEFIQMVVEDLDLLEEYSRRSG
jgi:hypothetical protein